MTKTILPLVLLLISSCSFVEIKDIPAYSKLFIFGAPDIVITNEYYLEKPFSFAKVKLGRSGVVILSLRSIDKGTYSWIGEDGTRIYTRNGKIIQTFGLDHNVSYLTEWNYPFTLSYFKATSEIQLGNPTALLSQQSTLSFSHEELINLEKDYQAKVFIEAFTSNQFKWSEENMYWVSERGRVIKSIQKIHPNLEEIEITFYYK
jgi:hypothetical protein|tara:strand:- start:660 stop:1271 length:612 start_codon:yes stop_codon:yes gene_type:complete